MSLAKRNRRAGHNYERSIAMDYREAGFSEAVTTRAESRNLDARKVDIANIPFYPQCKYGYKSMSVNEYIKILKEMDELLTGLEEHPLILHHRKGRAKFNDLVIMPRKHFFELIKKLKQ